MTCILGHIAVEGIRKAYSTHISILPQAVIDDYIRAGFKNPEEVIKKAEQNNKINEKLDKIKNESRQMWNFILKSNEEQVKMNAEMAVENAI